MTIEYFWPLGKKVKETVPDRDVWSQLARPTRAVECSLLSEVPYCCVYCLSAIGVILACDVYLG